ncbi:hypothetical protein [Aliivibrio sp. S10_S31]|uniref:hypothetical protein n=1 Tax=Aliivibrio sp. S10_S31 TaxID=2720224 RepID=UPI00167FE692|nr:hypothetical protein [Aliivibrio sp. S10_S31]MBD1571538.1 hypothetical protein [Aliivibrio sp. S10_S31]
MEISNTQSLLQFLAAIYLVIEWVNIERIVGHYKNLHKKEIGSRMSGLKKYNSDLEGLWSELQDENCAFMSTYQLDKNFKLFKRICLFFFVLCFLGLVLTSFYGDESLPKLILFSIFIFLCFPFMYVLIKLILPAWKEYKTDKALIEEILLPLEKRSSEFKENNPFPQVREAVKKMRSGDKLAIKKHQEKMAKYWNDYDKFMRNSL